MIIILDIFGQQIIIDTDVNDSWIIKDGKTHLTYRVSNDGEDITIKLYGKLFEASAFPSGTTCPTCKGSGRV